MSKTTILVIIITIVVLAAGAVTGYYLLKPSAPSKTPYPTARPLEESTDKLPDEKKVSDSTYSDSSGFSFKYPDNTTVLDTTPNDATYYTQLTVQSQSEKLIFSVKDTKSKTITDWLKTKEAPVGARLSGETKMGGMSAEQYETDDKFITIVIDSGVLYLIDSPKNQAWEDIQNKIVTSFAFAGSQTSASAGSSASDTIYEEETVE